MGVRATGHMPPTRTMTDSDATIDPRVERTRRAVLEAGVALLYEHGPDGVTHASVATEAGVSRTTLYKYWPTRAKLLFDIFSSFHDDDDHTSSGDIRADLVAMLSEHQRSMSDPQRRRMFVSMLAQAQWDADVVEAKTELKAVPLADLEAVIESGVASGRIRSGVHPEAAASRLLGPLMFASLVVDDATLVDVESIVDDWLWSVRCDPG